MIVVSLVPVWLEDFLGSVLMILLSALCLRVAFLIYRRDTENPLGIYLIWFCGALFAFSLSRSLGHIVRHALHFFGQGQWWTRLSPISGSVNSITFVVIASVTLFFHRMQAIISRMARDREKLEKTGSDLLELNRDLENIVFERTRAEMALRVAHDIRNPAVIIGGLIKRLFEEEPGEEGRERVRKVMEQARKLESLVTKFENIRSEPGKAFEPLDLNVLIQETIETLGREAEAKKVTLELDLSPALLVFQGNEQLLKIAIMHLVRNAIEVSGPGDMVRIVTELGPQGIVMRVRDNGPGIPRDMLDHLFEPFYTAKSGATGLGLPYVKQIIEEHKGRLLVRNEPGGGASAEIILPTHLGILREKELSR